MNHPLKPSEAALLGATILAIVAAALAPSVAQHAHHHAFADSRVLWGMPFAMDVLSNLAFAVMGLWGLWRLWGAGQQDPFRRGVVPQGTQRHLASLFFVGLLSTAACSSWYHLGPNDAGLVADRMGMVLAFAGVLGLAVADRVSARAGGVMALAVLVLGPVAVGVWAITGNVLPWVILQGGGMVLVACMAARRPIDGAWGAPLAALIAWYVVAKLLELGDHELFTLTQGLVSGHSLKHVAAAMAAWPLIARMHNGGHAQWRRVPVAHA